MMIKIFILLLLVWPIPAPPTDGQTRTLYEPFDLPSLNTTLWNYGYPWGSYYNHRANTIPRQVKITPEGLLNITATRERSINLGLMTEFGLIDLDFTSGAVNTNGKFCIKNGYVEVSVRAAATESTWPSVFLVPEDQGQVPMLTVMEVFDSRSRYSYGFKYTNGIGAVEEAGGIATSRQTSDAVHRFGVDWGYDQITWYYDDQWVRTITQSNELRQVNSMCLVIGLGVGGKSKETAIIPQAYPSIMNIDLVEIWQPKYDGFYKFQNVQTNLLMEIDSASQDSGARILQWHDLDGDWQVEKIADDSFEYKLISSYKYLL
jgi:beta-glucanase (GH16 family)